MKMILGTVMVSAAPVVKRLRTSRRPIAQVQDVGPYRLPRMATERLLDRIQGVRNGEAVFVLATFLARFHATPNRLGEPFCIDRRALAGHDKLGLTEARVRGAIRVLIEAGFLEPVSVAGSAYRPTETGLRKKPVQFVFSQEFLAIFKKAVSRSQGSGARRPLRSHYLAQKDPSGRYINPGETKNQRSSAPNPTRNEKLEAALLALRNGVLGEKPASEEAGTG